MRPFLILLTISLLIPSIKLQHSYSVFQMNNLLLPIASKPFRPANRYIIEINFIVVYSNYRLPLALCSL